MSEYTPDRWCVIRIPGAKETVYKVFASWSGSYTGGDSWKLNSGITQAVLLGSVWEFEGTSGSVYRCRPNSYGTNAYGRAVLDDMITRTHEGTGIDIEILDEHTNWASLDYDPLQQWIRQGGDLTQKD
jgi:hypothetical protein